MESAVCPRCQTILSITSEAFSLACSSCQTWLTVDRGDTQVQLVAYDDAPAAATESISPAGESSHSLTTGQQERLEQARRESVKAVEQLDAEWQQFARKSETWTWNGTQGPPDEATALFLGGIGVFAAWMAYSGLGLPGPVNLVAAALAALGGAVLAFQRYQQAQQFQSLRERYRRQRRVMLSSIQPDED